MLHTTALILAALVALLHLYFLVLEMFLWQTPRVRRAFGTTADFARESATLAKNQGLYNGFLAAGITWGVIAGGSTGFAFRAFFLGCVVIAGLYGGLTASHRILPVQMVPGAVALALTIAAGS
jgi:putative membrane protein